LGVGTVGVSGVKTQKKDALGICPHLHIGYPQGVAHATLGKPLLIHNSLLPKKGDISAEGFRLLGANSRLQQQQKGKKKKKGFHWAYFVSEQQNIN
jgi:hypothetical protein